MFNASSRRSRGHQSHWCRRDSRCSLHRSLSRNLRRNLCNKRLAGASVLPRDEPKGALAALAGRSLLRRHRPPVPRSWHRAAVKSQPEEPPSSRNDQWIRYDYSLLFLLLSLYWSFLTWTSCIAPVICGQWMAEPKNVPMIGRSMSHLYFPVDEYCRSTYFVDERVFSYRLMSRIFFFRGKAFFLLWKLIGSTLFMSRYKIRPQVLPFSQHMCLQPFHVKAQ